MTDKSTNTIRAFTLIELLAVIAIIAILAALLFPLASSMIKKGRQASVTNSLRTLGVGINLYAAEHDGALPGPSTVAIYGWARNPSLPSDLAHLGQFIGPYLEPDKSSQDRANYDSLQNPALPETLQNNQEVAQFVRYDAVNTAQLEEFPVWGGWAMTLKTAAETTPQPKRLQGLSAKARSAAVITTVDKQTWNTGNTAIRNLLPDAGPFNGKRVWLFLDGSVSAPTDAPPALWFR